MINLVAFITAENGRRDEVLARMRNIIGQVRAEDGCIEYRPTIDIAKASRIQAEAGNNTVIVIEKWRDREALRAHMNAPHMVKYSAQVKDLIAERRVFFLADALVGP